MARVVTASTVDRAGLAAVLRPRTQPVREHPADPRGSYGPSEGPVLRYLRTVTVTPVTGDGERSAVTEVVDYALAVPYFAWLMRKPFELALRRPGDARPWWLPPGLLDAQASTVLGALAAVAIVFGYLNTLFTQTIAFAGDEFGAGNGAQGVAGGVVRAGGVLALAMLVLADRRGRRRVVLMAALGGCILAATGALAPSLPWLTASQLMARAMASALLVVVGIMVAEEMPAGSRAWAVSVLAMAAGFGAAICVASLRLADLGVTAWRILYLLPLAALPLVADIGRRLPESRRFARPHVQTTVRGHGRRLALLAVSGFAVNLFVAPQSQFFNRFLKSELGYSGGAIALVSIGTGTIGGLGIIVGGRLADVRGRRQVAFVALLVGTATNVALYFTHGGVPLWAWAALSSVFTAAEVPALGVYGPELFPTSLRGRVNGLITVLSLAGSAVGLALAGALADHYGRIGPALALLALGPAALAVLVVTAYPETAGLELEDINPEDRGDP